MVSTYLPVDKPKKHQTRRTESSSNTAVRTPNTALPQQLLIVKQDLAWPMAVLKYMQMEFLLMWPNVPATDTNSTLN